MVGCSVCRHYWLLSDSNPDLEGYKPIALTTATNTHHWAISFHRLENLTNHVFDVSDQDLNLEVPCTTTISWARERSTSALCALGRLGAVIGLPGAVILDVLRNALLRITLLVPDVVSTENWDTNNLPFLLDSSSTANMQSESLVTGRRYVIDRRVLPGVDTAEKTRPLKQGNFILQRNLVSLPEKGQSA